MPPDSSDFLARVLEDRTRCAVPAQAHARAEAFARDLLALLFPHFAGASPATREAVEADFRRALCTTEEFVGSLPEMADRAGDIARAFGAQLPPLRDALLGDAQATYDADPAARSLDEVIAAYPGFLALACYRFAHALDGLGVPLLPRLVTEHAHRMTGIDIHPGARIGRAISIDHGTGIVVGETAVIGDRVRMYQGVTLGALSVSKLHAHSKRHPTIEDDVILYANATILGGDTVIGARSVIGGNVWLTRSVPPDSVVTEVPHVEHRAAPGDGPTPTRPS